MDSGKGFINGFKIDTFRHNTLVVGSGAAGLNAADRLWQYGQRDVAIITENVNAGTSRNTGSDKQTYYKLALSGKNADSVGRLAQDLYNGRCVDGDLALCEAALSVQCFFRLVELGVPFPNTEHGVYAGYKTDHDSESRATSAGPYTSRMMTECLQRSVESRPVKVYDHMQAIRIVTDGNRAAGVLCLNLAPEKTENSFALLLCKNLVWAVGGPAGMYRDSVYPFGHHGASGLAFEAGAHGRNLTEWQYGLASVRPRWNVSGTYMQALPRFVSVGSPGEEPEEFLRESFSDPYEILNLTFLKGYQWPFDVRRVCEGSSLIDLLVYQEICLKGRRVYLDYTRNPGDGVIDLSRLCPEASEYLQRAGAVQKTPFERLKHMNEPAAQFYQEHGVCLDREMLEIAVCAQHNNGGIAVNSWWETDVEGLYAVGEAAGTHGVYRPGGAALNAGQVGSMRAAQKIAACGCGEAPLIETLSDTCRAEIGRILGLSRECIGVESNLKEQMDRAVLQMSRVGAAVRDVSGISEELERLGGQLRNFGRIVKIHSEKEWGRLYQFRDTLIGQYVYLSAMENYVRKGGGSRGSALYTDPNGSLPRESLPESFRFCLEAEDQAGLIQEAEYCAGKCCFSWRAARPVPLEDEFFENVWREYRTRRSRRVGGDRIGF